MARKVSILEAVKYLLYITKQAVKTACFFMLCLIFSKHRIKINIKLGYIHVTFAIFLAFHNIIISNISNYVYQRYCHFFIFRTEITFFVYLASKLVNSLNCWFLCNTVNATDSSVNWPENS